MSRPQTILTFTPGGPRYVEVCRVAQYGISERISDAQGKGRGEREVHVFLTASFGGTDIAPLYGFSATIAPVDSDLSKNDVDRRLKEAAQQALDPLRDQATNLLRSFNNFLHSNEDCPSLITLDWFIRSGRYAKFASPEKDALAKLPDLPEGATN